MNICLIFNERLVLNWLRPVRTSNWSRPVLISFLQSFVVFDQSSLVFWGIGALVDQSWSRSKPLEVKDRDWTRLSITMWFAATAWCHPHCHLLCGWVFINGWHWIHGCQWGRTSEEMGKTNHDENCGSFSIMHQMGLPICGSPLMYLTPCPPFDLHHHQQQRLIVSITNVALAGSKRERETNGPWQMSWPILWHTTWASHFMGPLLCFPLLKSPIKWVCTCPHPFGKGRGRHGYIPTSEVSWGIIFEPTSLNGGEGLITGWLQWLRAKLGGEGEDGGGGGMREDEQEPTVMWLMWV